MLTGAWMAKKNSIWDRSPNSSTQKFLEDKGRDLNEQVKALKRSCGAPGGAPGTSIVPPCSYCYQVATTLDNFH